MHSPLLWQLPFILILCFVIFLASDYIGKRLNQLFLPESLRESFGARGFYLKLLMIVLSMAAILVLGKGDLRAYGFVGVGAFDWLDFLWKSTATLAAGFAVFLGIVATISIRTQREPVAFPKESFRNHVLFIWIWSSLAEEVLTRGLLQSYLAPFGQTRFMLFGASISLPVLISALFFSAMHLGLLRKMTRYFVLALLFDTFVMGLVAGYYREQSGSLIPAVWVHMIGNMIGSIPLLLSRLARAQGEPDAASV